LLLLQFQLLWCQDSTRLALSWFAAKVPEESCRWGSLADVYPQRGKWFSRAVTWRHWWEWQRKRKKKERFRFGCWQHCLWRAWQGTSRALALVKK
jgi:hypothetical protein